MCNAFHPYMLDIILSLPQVGNLWYEDDHTRYTFYVEPPNLEKKF